MMMFGQTRIFFVMSRDGLLPQAFSKIHPKFHTPHVITIITGVAVALFAAFFPVGQLANISNSGTLFAFAAVSIARSEEHTSELQSLMRNSYAVFCLKKKKTETIMPIDRE